MRLTNYRVKRADGTEFYTTSYAEASKKGNYIEETYFTPIDERTEEEKKWQEEHAKKVFYNKS